MELTIRGHQDAGVQATAKHYIGNVCEQSMERLPQSFSYTLITQDTRLPSTPHI